MRDLGLLEVNATPLAANWDKTYYLNYVLLLILLAQMMAFPSSHHVCLCLIHGCPKAPDDLYSGNMTGHSGTSVFPVWFWFL